MLASSGQRRLIAREGMNTAKPTRACTEAGAIAGPAIANRTGARRIDARAILPDGIMPEAW